jgi:hypothetical protein
MAERAAYIRLTTQKRGLSALLVALWMMVLMVVLSLVGGSASPWIIFLVGAGVPGSVGLLIWARQADRLAPITRLTLVSSGRCAQCGYNLIHVNPEGDGCTVCPECGAAWRLDGGLRERLAANEASDRCTAPDDLAANRRARSMMRDIFRGFGGNRHFAVVDDRGRMVDVVQPSIRRHPPAGWKAMPPSDRRLIRRRLGLLGWGKRAVVAGLFGPALGLMVWQLVLRTTPEMVIASPVRVLPMLMWGVFFPLFYALYVARPQPGSGKPIARLLMSRGYCPTCATGLRAVEPESDGCRVCPCCLSAWNFEKRR